MVSMHSCQIRSITNKADCYELDNVEFLGDGLKRLYEACNGCVTRDNQIFRIKATCDINHIPKKGRYSAVMQLLLPETGVCWLYTVNINNADFSFFDFDDGKVKAEIVIYPLPNAKMACQMRKAE